MPARSISSASKIFAIASGRRHIYHYAIDALIYRVPLRSLSLPFSLFSLSPSLPISPCLFRSTIHDDVDQERKEKEILSLMFPNSVVFQRSYNAFPFFSNLRNLDLSQAFGRKSDTFLIYEAQTVRLACQPADVT